MAILVKSKILYIISFIILLFYFSFSALLSHKGDNLFALFNVIIIIGASLNFLVVSSNNFKMPVIYDKRYDLYAIPSSHFIFKSKKKIKFWALADIFKVSMKKKILAFSLGDFLIILGFILSIGAIL